jgi:hypothetical protein
MKRPSPVFALLIALAAACRREPAPARAPSDIEVKAPESLSALGFAADRQNHARALVPMPAASPAPTSAPGPRLASSLKLIRTATLQVEVPDFRAAVEEASRAAAGFGGYVSDRQSSENGSGHDRGQITLRIPSDRFDGALSALKKLGRVKNEGVQAQDVTKAYADLETRLTVKRETAARLREILTRQTGKVSEVLEVEREIARVVEEIEQAEGERRYFDNQVSLSTVTLSLYEPDAMVTPGALDPVVLALRQSLRMSSESLAALINLTAGLLPWLCALYLAFRLARWRRSRRS